LCLSFELGVLLVDETQESSESPHPPPLRCRRLGFRGGWPLPYDVKKAEVNTVMAKVVVV
jgi:hypothetical protein